MASVKPSVMKVGLQALSKLLSVSVHLDNPLSSSSSFLPLTPSPSSWLDSELELLPSAPSSRSALGRRPRVARSDLLSTTLDRVTAPRSTSTGESRLLLELSSLGANFSPTHRREEIEAYVNEGIVTHAGLAFSRDTDKKVYIQHKMNEDAALLAEMLEDGAFYLCGPTWLVSRLILSPFDLQLTHLDPPTGPFPMSTRRSSSRSSAPARPSRRLRPTLSTSRSRRGTSSRSTWVFLSSLLLPPKLTSVFAP